VRRSVEALGRTCSSSSSSWMISISQRCKLCGTDVDHRVDEGPGITAADLLEGCLRSYDEHDCARRSSSLYWTNDGLDELYARTEALSVEMAGRALDLVRSGARPQLIARAEHESRELARRAKTLEWILERGALAASNGVGSRR